MTDDSTPSVLESNHNTSHEIEPVSSPTPILSLSTAETTLKIPEEIEEYSSYYITALHTSTRLQNIHSFFKLVSKLASSIHSLPFTFKYTLYYCVVFLVLAVIFGLLISGFVVVVIAALPLLLLSLIVVRLLQVIQQGEAYDNAIQLKLFIRTWILIDMVAILILLWLFYSALKYAAGLKDALIMGLRLTNWARIYYVIFGIHIFSFVTSVITFILLPLVPLDNTESGMIFPDTVLEIMDYLIFWLAESEVMKRVSSFKQHEMLGLRTQKWIEVTISILIVCNAITLSTHMIVLLLKELVCNLDPGTYHTKSLRYLIIEKYLRREYLVYWVNGIKRSINFILSSLMILLIWVSYFGSHLNKTARAEKLLEFGFWTCISLLICAFLWLIKTCVLLSWEAASVYSRLKSKILGGKKLYFLGIIDRYRHDILNQIHDRGGGKVIMKFLGKMKRPIEHELLRLQKDRTPTVYGLQQAAEHILTAKNILLKDNYIGDTLKHLARHCGQKYNGSIKDYLENEIQFVDDTNDKRENSKKTNRDHVEELLLEYMGSSAEISFEELQSWMEIARDNCLLLANTLSSAKEVVDCLNKIISWLLLIATFIMWLLLTGLATTKVLVLIASPLLAATFIFGDACKTLFQGIMFAYVIHPFDVGDLCVIDGNMMEVKTVGVWQTSFSKVGMQENVMYPNSELSNKKIINHRTDFDWNDFVELDVASLGEEKVKILKHNIETYLDVEENDFLPSYNSVEVLKAGESLTISVNFRHNNNVSFKNKTYFECLKEKRKRRSEFILHAQNFMDENKYGEQKT